MKLTLATLLVLSQSAFHAFAQEYPKPDVCDAGTGKWDPYHINCDFDCDNTGWEVKCVCDEKDSQCNEIECRVDRDGAPASEDIYFTCTSLGDGESPDCDLAPLLDSTLAGSCVKNTIGQVLDAWVLGVSD